MRGTSDCIDNETQGGIRQDGSKTTGGISTGMGDG